MNKIIKEAEQPRTEGQESPLCYYYQMAKTPDPFLPNQWVCCGMVDEKTKSFYLDYFSRQDTRGFSCPNCPDGYRVIIVSGYRGNVAGRLETKIGKNGYYQEAVPFNEDTDILEKYNW